MGFRILYKPLCAVTVRHGFHLNDGGTEFDDLNDDLKAKKLAAYDLADDLRVHVPAESERTLRGLGSLLRTTKTGFVIGTEVEERSEDVFVPTRPPTGPFKICIVLEGRQPYFVNYTNVSLKPGGRKIYYLNNRAGVDANQAGQQGRTFPDLAFPARSYQGGVEYVPGDVVRSDDGHVFLALRGGPHGVPTNADPWLQLGRRNYVDTTDQATLRPPLFEYAPPRDMVRITMLSLTLEEELLLPSEDRVHKLRIDGSSLQEGPPVLVDARGFPTGAYRLVVVGEDEDGNDVGPLSERVYLDGGLLQKNVVAIVELFHALGDVTGDFRLYDDEASEIRLLARGEFVVRLLNRHTFWRYQFREKPTPSDLGDLERISDHVYVTRQVMPLTRGVQPVTFNSQLLPNPTVEPVVLEDQRVLSDVHIHVNP